MQLIGFVQALLTNISAIAGLDDPQLKITPAGFLQALLENPTTTQISNLREIRGGMERELKVRYQRRGTPDEVTTIDDCDTPISPEWLETSIGRPYFSKIGIRINDSDMRKYQDEATRTLAAGQPAVPLMLALYETILTRCQGMIQHMDQNLLAAQAGNWGVNVVTGNNAAQTVTFSNTPTINDGIMKIMSDYQLNEMYETPIIVGNGAVINYNRLQSIKNGTDSGGFGANGLPKTYLDIASISKWGANKFGLFTPGMIGLVDFNKNVGSFAGEKGGAVFFTLPVPVQLANGTLSSLVFDAQLWYDKCPAFAADGTLTQDRGWNLLLSKSYGLFNAPVNMFKDTDRLKGVNGSFLYTGAALDATVVAPSANSVWTTDAAATATTP